MRSTLIIPTLNERDGVEVILPRIDPTWVDELIVVDGGSTDGTVEWCTEHGYRVLRQKGRGYGTAIAEAIAVTTGDILVDFTPDGNSIPEKIPPLIDKVKEGYDLVIASRYLDGAVSDDDDLMTGFGNWMFTRMLNALYGTDYTDALVGFRAYRRAAWQALDMREPSLAAVIESSARFPRHGFRVAEISADEPKRIGGTRKMRRLKTGARILEVMLKERIR